MMRRVAIEATNIAVGMTGFRKMGLSMTLAVAAQTAGAGLLSRMPFENEYLSLVAAPSYVLGTRPMAPLAALVRWPAFRVQRRLPVRRFLPVVLDLFVAGLAGLRADILRYLEGGLTWHGVGCRLSATGLAVLVRTLLTSLTRSGVKGEETQRRDQKNSRHSVANFLAHKSEIPPLTYPASPVPSTSGIAPTRRLYHRRRIDCLRIATILK